MHLFTTILFVDGNPVRYEVRLTDNHFCLYPIDNPNDNIEPPVIKAQWYSGEWTVSGTTDRDLIAQVVEDMNGNSASLPCLN